MNVHMQRLISRGAVLAAAILLGAYPFPGGKIILAADKAPQGPQACLACHGGSFDDLAGKKAFYKAPGGETINPHQYIPHNEKKAENVPDCLGCHSKHPLPPAGKVDVSKVSIESCYLSCHHQQNFARCGTCHDHKK